MELCYAALPMFQFLLATLLLLATLSSAQTKPDSLDQLSSDLWSWRARYRPFTFDDVPRMEHAGGVRDWSEETVARQRLDLAAFERRWKQMNSEDWTVAKKVDYQLVGSALARVRWELDVYPRWRLDPMFYVEQTVVALQEELIAPPPFTPDRGREIVVRAENIPSILLQARSNLKPVNAFAGLAIEALANIESRLQPVASGVSPLLTSDDLRARFQAAMPKAMNALLEYRGWLQRNLPGMRREFVVGGAAYSFYLHRVALLPYTPEQMLEMARQDLDRVLTAESLEKKRDIAAPELKIAATAEDEIARMARDDESIRRFLVTHELLTVPSDLPHWTLRAAPDYVAAFSGLAELDDFTGPSRPEQDGTRWIQPPASDMPYFSAAYAKDARTTGVHEGVPGHFFQLSLARRNPDPVRRQYYDSVANEGLGFYSEEMMLQAGLYDDAPRSREIIYSFARLRALRVEVDVKLALGQFTIAQAADYLARMVPMDRKSAENDAADYAASPGLGVAYEIGKLQIERMLARRRLQQGTEFNLRQFQDQVWMNGNVPFSLLQWELLGFDDDVKTANELGQ
jgi:Bacterial protein of unknown function (DUF885)